MRILKCHINEDYKISHKTEIDKKKTTVNKKEVLSYHIYMWNAWCKEECAHVFNKPSQEWKYSLGEHIWNEWCRFCEKHGSKYAPADMVSELDESTLQKIIDRACELYEGRKNK